MAEAQARTLSAKDWPGLLTLKFPVENPLKAGLEGRVGVYRGTDPVPDPEPEEREPGIVEKVLDFGKPPSDNPITSAVNGAMKNGLIAVTGLVILAVGLFALVSQVRGGINAS